MTPATTLCGSIAAQSRSYAGLEAEQFNVPEFFQRVSADPAMAQELMLRLSVRLREIEDKIADDLPLAHVMAKDDQPLARSALTEFQIVADTNTLRGRMGASPSRSISFLSSSVGSHGWARGRQSVSRILCSTTGNHSACLASIS